MTLQRQISFWVLSLLSVIFMLWLFNDILLPFVVGMVLAYFLDPIADALERRKIPRIVATGLILGTVTIVFLLLVFLLVPTLVAQVVSFAEKLPEYLHVLSGLFNDAAPDWLKTLITNSGSSMPDQVSSLASKAALWLASLVKSLWTGGMALVNMLSLMIVTPVVAFYMLNDWDRMVAKVDGWLPLQHRDTIRDLARQIDAAMAGFIRGQGTVCLILGSFYAIALISAGLSFGLLIGFAAGLMSFIPYIGAIIGGVVAIGMALVQFWPDWISITFIVVIFALGQFLEGNFLSPKLVGNRVGLHPVWLMFALFAFGYLLGFAGLLLAVPLAAAFGVLVRFALQQYLASNLYLGPTKAVKKTDKSGSKTRS